MTKINTTLDEVHTALNDSTLAPVSRAEAMRVYREQLDTSRQTGAPVNLTHAALVETLREIRRGEW